MTTTARAGNLQGVLVILAAVMPVMAIVTLVPVLPMLGKEFASVPGSEYLVPAALTVPAFCLAIFSPAAGWLADKIGRKNLLVISLFLYSALGVLPYFLTDLKQIIAARFGLGIVEAAIMTVATTLIGDYFEGKRREFWLSVQVATAAIAAVLLVILGGLLAGALGSRGPFLLYLVAFPLALICIFSLFEPMASANDAASGAKHSLPWGRLAPLVAGGFFFGVLFYVVMVKLGNILALQTAVTPEYIGKMSGIVNAGMIAGAVLFGVLKARLSGPGLLTLGALLITGGYLGMTVAPSAGFTVAMCFTVAFGSGLLLPTFLTWLMTMLELEVRGRGTGCWQGAFFLGQFVAPMVAVALSKQLGGLGATFYVFAAVALIIAVAAATQLKGGIPLAEESALAPK